MLDRTATTATARTETTTAPLAGPFASLGRVISVKANNMAARAEAGAHDARAHIEEAKHLADARIQQADNRAKSIVFEEAFARHERIIKLMGKDEQKRIRAAALWTEMFGEDLPFPG